MFSPTAAAQGLVKLAKLERMLALICLTAPFFLIEGDNWHVRDSISAYYNIDKAVLFYVPLTVAFMLFVVNGLVKDRHPYNTVLGAALAGLVLLNHHDFKIAHLIFAAIFFLGNAYVIVKYSSREERWFKIGWVAVIAIALASWGFGLITLFWAEWISLCIIGIHYILESLEVIT